MNHQHTHRVHVVLDADTSAECDRRPFPAVTASTPGDHAPTVDFTANGTAVRLSLAEDLTADDVRTLYTSLGIALGHWLDDIKQYAADLQAREDSKEAA